MRGRAGWGWGGIKRVKILIIYLKELLILERSFVSCERDKREGKGWR